MLRISKKSFLIAFVAALILFSGIMAIVCYHAFSSHVFVHYGETVTDSEPLCVAEPQIYYCLDPESGAFEYGVLVFRDATSGEAYLMHIEGEWLATYKGALYYVKSLYAADPQASLCLLYNDLAGANTDPAMLVDARSLLSDSKKNSHLRYSTLAELLATNMGVTFKEIAPAFVEQEGPKLIDVAQTRRLFGTAGK